MESMPQLCNTYHQEIELDINTLDPAMLWKFYTYVMVPKPAAASSAPTTAGAAALGKVKTNSSSSAAANYKHQQQFNKRLRRSEEPANCAI
jgi:hypothetical protein